MKNNTPTLVVVFSIVIVLSIYLGVSAASAKSELLGLGGAIALITILITMGRHIWLLIPAVSMVGLFLRWLPGSLRIAELAMICVIIGYFQLLLLRRAKLRLHFGVSHFFVLLFIATVVQTYMRNPTGLSVFGSGSVGGRGYVNFGLAVLCAAILGAIEVSNSELLRAKTVALWGGFITVVAEWLSYIPGLNLVLTMTVGTRYMGEGAEGAGGEGGGVGRNKAATQTSNVLSKWLISRISPLSALVRPFWLLVMLVSLVMAAMSGFRSRIFLVGLTYLVSIFCYNRFKGVFIAMFIGMISLAFLILLSVSVQLPERVQRSLSFLPGGWDQSIVRDGEGSTDWRMEIWTEALSSERWIRNRVFGDGLGFSSEELAMQEAAMKGQITVDGLGRLNGHQVTVLINGDYHSGPVSFIKVVGFVGFIAFMLAMISIAVEAYKLIKLYRESPHFGFYCFMLIPMVVHPIHFTLVIGGFSGDAALLLLNLGMLTLIKKNPIVDDLEEEGAPLLQA